MMAAIAFIAVLIGAAGIAGGIDTGSGVVTSAVILLLGIMGMVIALYKDKRSGVYLVVSCLGKR